MKTIEDLKIEKTTYKKEKDENGNVVEFPVTRMIRRNPEVVKQGVRFGYFLIDVVFYYIFTIIVGVIIGLVVVATDNVEMLRPGTSFNTLLNWMGYPLFFIYYGAFEGTMGTSLGKLICGYTVINERAEKVGFGQAMLRTLCRFIPFEAFSCFAERGWHDTLSKTYVVKKSEKIELQKLLGNFSDTQTDILD